MSTALETNGNSAPPRRAFEKLKKDIELHLFEKSEDGKSIVSTCKECNLSQKTSVTLPAYTQKDLFSDPTGIHRFDTCLLIEFSKHLHDGRDFTNYYLLPPAFGDYYYEIGGDSDCEDGGEDDSDDSGAEEDDSEDSGAEEDESEDSRAEEETGEGAECDREIEKLVDTIEDGLQF